MLNVNIMCFIPIQEVSQVLRTVKLQIISDETCQKHGGIQPLPGMICAAQPNGEGITTADVCQVSLVMRILQYLVKQQFIKLPHCIFSSIFV